jgi:hypothetical protein
MTIMRQDVVDGTFSFFSLLFLLSTARYYKVMCAEAEVKCAILVLYYGHKCDGLPISVL